MWEIAEEMDDGDENVTDDCAMEGHEAREWTAVRTL